MQQGRDGKCGEKGRLAAWDLQQVDRIFSFAHTRDQFPVNPNPFGSKLGEFCAPLRVMKIVGIYSPSTRGVISGVNRILSHEDLSTAFPRNRFEIPLHRWGLYISVIWRRFFFLILHEE